MRRLTGLRLAPSPSVQLWAVLTGTVVAATLAYRIAGSDPALLASSPARFLRGRLWYLLSSGLVAQSPLALSLFSFALLAAATIAVCGRRATWELILLGHVGSTLLAYAVAFAASGAELVPAQALERPDYGVSAVQAAWIGALAAAAWRRPGQTRGGRIWVAAGVAAIGGVAYLVRSDLGVVDCDHGFALALGVAVALRHDVRLAWKPVRRRVGELPRPARAAGGARSA